MLRPYLELMRPANIVTAIADILGGFSVAYWFAQQSGLPVTAHPVWLVVATIALYGGGITLNDTLDAKNDSAERPERPIPRGAVSVRNAYIFSSSLLLLGIIAGFLAHPLSGYVALLIVFFVVLYDSVFKHHPLTAPLGMGICRGLNFLLGLSSVSAALSNLWTIAFIPLLYVAAITLISRHETNGHNRAAVVSGSVLYAGAFLLFIILVLPIAPHPKMGLALLTILYVLLGKKISRAYKTQLRLDVISSIKTAVLFLIIFNASYAAAFVSIYAALGILLLLPFSFIIAKTFSVT